MTSTRCPLPCRSIVAAWVSLVALGSGAAPAGAQVARVGRPIPAAVSPPPEYQRAIERGWRSQDGSPGHSYWQQGATYDIEARLDPVG